MLLGGNVTVKKGSDRGGDFQHLRACRTARQIGCVVAFSTFNAPVPDERALRPHGEPALEILCTNPAALGGGSGHGSRRSIRRSRSPQRDRRRGERARRAAAEARTPPGRRSPMPTAAAARPPEGRASSSCVPRGRRVHAHAHPDATWGLHLADANIALGNLHGPGPASDRVPSATRVETPFFRLWGLDPIGRSAYAADNLDMAHYLCPHCEDVVDFDGLARVTWCNGCGQPLSMFDLLPSGRPSRREPGRVSGGQPPALA